MKRHDKDGKCGKCKGSGNLPLEVVQNGICFWCMGYGSVVKFKEWSLKQSEKAKSRDINDAKNIIVDCYKRVEEWRSKGENDDFVFIKSAKDQANIYWNILKTHNVTFTLEEIKKMAE